MPRFTPEQAYEKGKRDMQQAYQAMEWFETKFGDMTAAQRERVLILALELRFEAHVTSGGLRRFQQLQEA